MWLEAITRQWRPMVVSWPSWWPMDGDVLTDHRVVAEAHAHRRALAELEVLGTPPMIAPCPIRQRRRPGPGPPAPRGRRFLPGRHVTSDDHEYGPTRASAASSRAAVDDGGGMDHDRRSPARAALLEARPLDQLGSCSPPPRCASARRLVARTAAPHFPAGRRWARRLASGWRRPDRHVVGTPTDPSMPGCPLATSPRCHLEIRITPRPRRSLPICTSCRSWCATHDRLARVARSIAVLAPISTSSSMRRPPTAGSCDGPVRRRRTRSRRHQHRPDGR